MKRHWQLLIVLVLVGSGLIGVFIAGRDASAGVKVTAAAIRVGTLAPEVFGIGTVEARRNYAIGPTMASRLARVLVDHGDKVSAGQLLAELDPVDVDERLASAGNALARAASVTAGAAAQLREAQSRAELATASAARYRDLLQKNFISRDALEIKQHEANAANAARSGAEAAHQAAMRDQARLEAERAAVGKLRAQYRLISPVQGIVLAREAEPGSSLVAGQAVIRLIDPASLWVRARIDQGRAAGLGVGQVATITLRSRPSHPYAGRVARVELQSDSVTEERVVDIAFEKIPDDLSPGEAAEVSVKLPAVADALLAPSAAIRRIGGNPVVLRIQGERAISVPVRVGRESPDGQTQVLEGVRFGDSVVQHATAELTGGERVKVVGSLIK